MIPARRRPACHQRPSSHSFLALLLLVTLAGCAARSPAGTAIGGPPAATSAARPATNAPATTAPRELLNSERIALRFGSYGIEVLEAAGRLRVSNLYSRDGVDGAPICRTFAVVLFPPVADPRIAREHREILAGGSLGAVLDAAGWQLEKRQLHLGEIPMPQPGDRLARLMGVSGSGRLAIRIYAMVARRGNATIDYATLAEVYHPSYLVLEDLQALVAPGGPAARATAAASAHGGREVKVPAAVGELLALVEAAARGSISGE